VGDLKKHKASTNTEEEKGKKEEKKKKATNIKLEIFLMHGLPFN